MDFLQDEKFWVELIGYASIVSVAIFGLVGALSKEWDRRRELRAKAESADQADTAQAAKQVTTFPWSYLAAMGIILSAVFAMTTSILQDWIAADQKTKDERKALDERTEQNSRFKAQIDQLTKLNGQIVSANAISRRLMADMGKSLARQDQLLTSARQTMLMTAGLTEQEGKNTGRVLHTMWNDANRIDASGLSLTVRYSCGLVSSGEPFPVFLAENTTVTILVAPVGVMRPRPLPDRTFSSLPSISSDQAARFTTSDQRVTVNRTRSVDGDGVTQTSRFVSFESEDLKGFDRPERWRNVAVEVLVAGYDQPLEEAAEALGEPLGDKSVLAEDYDISGIIDNDDYLVWMLPCLVDMTFVVNGRLVANADGRLVRFRDWEEDVDKRAIVKFPIVAAYEGIFPDFNLTGEGP